MGQLVTLELPADSPVLDMPWIITFGPLSDDEEWEPVVCGPYERPHALSLAAAVVADEDLMAVVEPLQPHVTVDQIRGDIAGARLAAEADEDEEFDEDEYEEFEDEDDEAGEEAGEESDDDLGPIRAEVEGDEDDSDEDDSDEDDEDDDDEDSDAYDDEDEGEYVEATPPPTPEEIRAGFARIAAKLTGG